MTFQKHLRSIFTAASQQLGILRNSLRVFNDRVLLERCFRGFVIPVLEYCSAVWCGCSVVLGRCNLKYSLYGDIPVPCMCQCELLAVLWSHIGILMRILNTEPSSTANFYSLLSISVERSCWPFTGWSGTGVFLEQSQCFFYRVNLLALCLFSILFYFLSFVSIGWYFGAGVFYS